jgi:hypothetical protein
MNRSHTGSNPLATGLAGKRGHLPLKNSGTSRPASSSRRNGSNRKTHASLAEMPVAPGGVSSNASTPCAVDPEKDPLGAFLLAPSQKA